MLPMLRFLLATGHQFLDLVVPCQRRCGSPGRKQTLGKRHAGYSLKDGIDFVRTSAWRWQVLVSRFSLQERREPKMNLLTHPQNWLDRNPNVDDHQNSPIQFHSHVMLNAASLRVILHAFPIPNPPSLSRRVTDSIAGVLVLIVFSVCSQIRVYNTGYQFSIVHYRFFWRHCRALMRLACWEF